MIALLKDKTPPKKKSVFCFQSEYYRYYEKNEKTFEIKVE